MKKGRIIHKDLNNLIGCAAHGDIIIVSDAGLAIPDSIWRIELAIERDIPDVISVLRLLNEELIIEKFSITEECRINNAPHYNGVLDVYRDMPVMSEVIPHEKLINEILPKAKAVIRTGSFSPYGNVVIYPGIDAPKWFEKAELVVPPFYQNRVKK